MNKNNSMIEKTEKMGMDYPERPTWLRILKEHFQRG